MEQLDLTLFKIINSGMTNPLFDVLCPLFRERLFWSPLYLFCLVFLLLNFKKRSWLAVAGLCLTIFLADSTSSNLIKKTVRRLRPCHQIELATSIRQRVHCGGGFSFTSSHATNHFAAAVFLGGIFASLGRVGWRRWLLGWAAAVSFSQVYVGVHFPADVVAGGLLGAAIGWGVFFVFREKGWLPTALNLSTDEQV